MAAGLLGDCFAFWVCVIALFGRLLVGFGEWFVVDELVAVGYLIVVLAACLWCVSCWLLGLVCFELLRVLFVFGVCDLVFCFFWQRLRWVCCGRLCCRFERLACVFWICFIVFCLFKVLTGCLAVLWWLWWFGVVFIDRLRRFDDVY